MTGQSDANDLRARLRFALTQAMKARDAVARTALRATLGAIDNAEAADPSAAPTMLPGRIAGGVAGLGAGEVARLELSEADVVEIVRNEIADRERAAAEYETSGHAEHAAALRAEAAVLRRFAHDE